MQQLKKKLASAILAVLDGMSGDHGQTAESILKMLEYPPDPAMGELSFPCFKFSRALRKAPPAIAAELASKISDDDIASVETAGGYLNFRVKPEYFTRGVVSKIIAEGNDYGKSEVGAGKTVVLDYSSPNVAKPFHLGHLGTTVIGHSLRLLHQFQGYKCIAVNHLGDWGTSMGKQIAAYKLWGSREEVERGGVDALVALYVRFHEEAERDPALFDRARAEFALLEGGDTENAALWKWFIDLSIEEYKKTYKQLDIEFDYYLGESFYSDKMGEQVELLREKGLLKLDEGAELVDLSAYNMPPCLILKRDGTTLYPTRDIAAAVYRYRNFKFDRAIYVTSAGQSLHFAQWFKIVELLGYPWADRLVHVPYGTMSVNGAKLGTRSGNTLPLKGLFELSIAKVREIMDEKNSDPVNRGQVAEDVGVGAIVFGYLSNSRIKDINFDLAEALNFDGNTGPYAQYTYARTCSVLAKAADAGYGTTVYNGSYSPNASEIELARTLSIFGEKIDDAVAAFEPSVIVRYILDICASFNRFYNNCRILTADTADEVRFRLDLVRATNITLSSALHLVCMKTPGKI
jgi:arginyl-tRNA synthetase